jgi:hypothetical protein
MVKERRRTVGRFSDFLKKKSPTAKSRWLLIFPCDEHNIPRRTLWIWGLICAFQRLFTPLMGTCGCLEQFECPHQLEKQALSPKTYNR